LCNIFSDPCHPKGLFHSSADCPKRQIKAGFPLPGFLTDGTRDISAWKGSKVPIKAIIAAWIAFLQDTTNFIAAGPTQAGIPGAPKLEDFQRRLALAPAKP
jgi:hypothetical protein